MKIAVAGCGIAGTTVAHLLAKHGFEVHVFEQAERCRPVGAGIMLQPSGQAVLDRLGILDRVQVLAQRLDGLTAALASGRELVHLRYEWLDPNLFALGVHRGELFQLLLELAVQSGAQIHTDSRITSFGGELGSVWCETESGMRHQDFDFLIGSDGSGSYLRSESGIPNNVIEYDYAALWATGRCDFQPGELYQVVQGTHRLVGLLPIGGSRSSFFWGLPVNEFAQLVNTPIENWKKEVLQVCPDAESLLGEIGEWSELTFAKYRHVSMSQWHNDRLIFLGDAGHGTSPHLGQGVNLALEDAVCFADQLIKCGDFASACKSFSKHRRSKLRYYSALTKMLSPFFQSPGKMKGRLRDIGLPWFPYMPVVRREMIRTLCGFKNGWIG